MHILRNLSNVEEEEVYASPSSRNNQRNGRMIEIGGLSF